MADTETREHCHRRGQARCGLEVVPCSSAKQGRAQPGALARSQPGLPRRPQRPPGAAGDGGAARCAAGGRHHRAGSGAVHVPVVRRPLADRSQPSPAGDQRRPILAEPFSARGTPCSGAGRQGPARQAAHHRFRRGCASLPAARARSGGHSRAALPAPAAGSPQDARWRALADAAQRGLTAGMSSVHHRGRRFHRPRLTGPRRP